MAAAPLSAVYPNEFREVQSSPFSVRDGRHSENGYIHNSHFQ